MKKSVFMNMKRVTFIVCTKQWKTSPMWLKIWIGRKGSNDDSNISKDFLNFFLFKFTLRKGDFSEKFFNSLWKSCHSNQDSNDIIYQSDIFHDKLKDYLKKLSMDHDWRPNIEQAFFEIQELKEVIKNAAQSPKEINVEKAFKNYFNFDATSNQHEEFKINRKSLVQRGVKVPLKFSEIQEKIIDQFSSQNEKISSYVYLDLRYNMN